MGNTTTATTVRRVVKPREYFVYIVESPDVDDFYLKRYEGEAMSELLKISQIPTEHKFALTTERLIDALSVEAIMKATKKHDKTPIIHLSGHGSSTHFTLTNGERVTWVELKKLILPINKILEEHLILCMSSCEGYGAYKMAFTTDKDNLPFRAIVGSKHKVPWSDTSVAFSVFYYLFIHKSKVFNYAVEGMNASIGNNAFTGKSAVTIMNSCTDEMIERMINSVLSS